MTLLRLLPAGVRLSIACLPATRCIERGVTVCACSAADETSSTFDRSDEEEEEESMLSEEAAVASEDGSEDAAPESSDWKTRKIKTASERKLLHERFGGVSPIS